MGYSGSGPELVPQLGPSQSHTEGVHVSWPFSSEYWIWWVSAVVPATGGSSPTIFSCFCSGASIVRGCVWSCFLSLAPAAAVWGVYRLYNEVVQLVSFLGLLWLLVGAEDVAGGDSGMSGFRCNNFCVRLASLLGCSEH